MSNERHPLEGKGLILVTGEVGPGRSRLLETGLGMLREKTDQNEKVTDASEIEYVYDGTKGE